MEFNGTFLVTIISFLVFVYLMNKVLYMPVRKIVNERRNFVEENYSVAKDNDKKAEELVCKREDSLISAKDDARKKYNEILDGYKSKRAEVIKLAQEESSKGLEEDFNHLNNVSNEAKESLKGTMNDLANDIVEKVLGYRSEVQGFDNDTINRVLYD